MLYLSRDTSLSGLFFIQTHGGALIDILYFRFASALSCLNKIDGMRTSFYNLSPSLKLML